MNGVLKMTTEQSSMHEQNTFEDQAQDKKPKKKLRGFLKAAFMGAVVTGGIKYLANSTASLAGLTGPAGIALAAISSGIALTVWGMASEYRQMRKEMEHRQALQKILSKDSLKKHGLKLLFNTASAAAGALSFVGIDFLLENTSAGTWVKEATTGLFSTIFGNLTPKPPITETAIEGALKTFESTTYNPAETITPENASPEITIDDNIPSNDGNTNTTPEEPPLPAPTALEQIAGLEGLGDQAMSTLKDAQNGNMRAMKDLAVYLFNGIDAMPADMQGGFEGLAQNKELAVQLYQQAADAGYTSAQTDLDYIESRGWMPQTPEPPAEPAPNFEAENDDTNAIPDIPGPAGDLVAAMAGQDLSPAAQNIYDGLIAGQDWALESAGTGLLNGSYGLPDMPKETALALVQQAADNGHVNAQINMAYFQYHGLHGAEFNQAQALETIKGLGKSWVGGEELLHNGRVALCDVFQNSHTANCDITNTEIQAGEYVEMTTSDGNVNQFYLADDAPTQSTNDFVSKRVLDTLTLMAQPR